jgi:hypothetical protein
VRYAVADGRAHDALPGWRNADVRGSISNSWVNGWAMVRVAWYVPKRIRFEPTGQLTSHSQPNSQSRLLPHISAPTTSEHGPCRLPKHVTTDPFLHLRLTELSHEVDLLLHFRRRMRALPLARALVVAALGVCQDLVRTGAREQQTQQRRGHSSSTLRAGCRREDRNLDGKPKLTVAAAGAGAASAMVTHTHRRLAAGAPRGRRCSGCRQPFRRP